MQTPTGREREREWKRSEERKKKKEKNANDWVLTRVSQPQSNTGRKQKGGNQKPRGKEGNALRQTKSCPSYQE
jgi:hypothetical protein